MRILIRTLVVCVTAVTLLVGSGLFWFYYYSRDLPNLRDLVQYAPVTVAQVSDPCLGHSIALPYDSVGSNLRNALEVDEVREDDPHVLTTFYRSFVGEHKLHRATLSIQISRTMFCTPSRQLHRELAELRAAAQLERQFSGKELFTIYANRAHFGDNLIGVDAAAQHLFRKNPAELNINQAALLAGMLRAPSFYSPFKHPDRAM
jgi:penicillin-binding protein 1A